MIEAYYQNKVNDSAIHEPLERGQGQGVRQCFQELFFSISVDDYEPESIWIAVENISDKDVRHFNELYGMSQS